MKDRVVAVLFICTGNSARSIMAEAILNHCGQGRFSAFSAGSHPTGQVNPLALKVLSNAGISTDSLRSKGWDEFAKPTAPSIEFVITVCDNAAGELCPIWPGHPTTAHWGLADPAAATCNDQQGLEAFRESFAVLERRIQRFIALPIASLNREELSKQLRAIGLS